MKYWWSNDYNISSHFEFEYHDNIEQNWRKLENKNMMNEANVENKEIEANRENAEKLRKCRK